MTVVRRSIVPVVFAMVALLASSGALLAQSPTCADAALNRVEQTYTNGVQTIVVSTPNDRPICNSTGCCDSIDISGVPSGWSVQGWVQSAYLFTCGGLPPQVIEYKSVNIVSTGADIHIPVCFPKSHDWPSFEIHVDLSLGIYDGGGIQQLWVGGDPSGAPGAIGPGLDWDPTCYTLGCTPGFWKNHCNVGCNQTLTWPNGYLPSTLFRLALDAPANKPNNSAGGPNLTLIDALGTGGGDEKAMVRHCAAALLNAAYVADNPWPGACGAFQADTPTVVEVQNIVKSAYAGISTFEEAHQACAAVNESLCPYDGVYLGVEGPGCAGSPCNPED